MAHFQFDLVLFVLVEWGKRVRVDFSGTATITSQWGFRGQVINERRTRKSESGCCARNGFRTRCASDLISRLFATHVYDTGVRRCAYLSNKRERRQTRSGFDGLYNKRRGGGHRHTPRERYPCLFHVLNVFEHELDGIYGCLARDKDY